MRLHRLGFTVCVDRRCRRARGLRRRWWWRWRRDLGSGRGHRRGRRNADPDAVAHCAAQLERHPPDRRREHAHRVDPVGLDRCGRPRAGRDDADRTALGLIARPVCGNRQRHGRRDRFGAHPRASREPRRRPARAHRGRPAGERSGRAARDGVSPRPCCAAGCAASARCPRAPRSPPARRAPRPGPPAGSASSRSSPPTSGTPAAVPAERRAARTTASPRSRQRSKRSARTATSGPTTRRWRPPASSRTSRRSSRRSRRSSTRTTRPRRSIFAPAFYPGLAPAVLGYSQAKEQCDASGNPLPSSQYTPVDLSGSGGTSIDLVITDALAGTGEGGYYYLVNEIRSQCGTAPPHRAREQLHLDVRHHRRRLPGRDGIPAVQRVYWLIPISAQHVARAAAPAALALQGASADRSAVRALPFDDASSTKACRCSPRIGDRSGARPAHRHAALYVRFLSSRRCSRSPRSRATSPTRQYVRNPPYGCTPTRRQLRAGVSVPALSLRPLWRGEIASIYNSLRRGPAPPPSRRRRRRFRSCTGVHRRVRREHRPRPPRRMRSRLGHAARKRRCSLGRTSRRRAAPVFGGPQPPETFNNGLVTGFVRLGPGTNATTFLIDGGLCPFRPRAPAGTT